jgi:hypothetical protein
LKVSISSLRTSADPTSKLVDGLLLQVDVLDVGVYDVLGDALNLLVRPAPEADARVELGCVGWSDPERTLETAHDLALKERPGHDEVRVLELLPLEPDLGVLADIALYERPPPALWMFEPSSLR